MSNQQETLTVQQALDRAARLYDAGRLPEAADIYQQVLRDWPDQHIALTMLGFIALQVGKHDIALDQLSRAVEIKTDNADAHHNLAIALNALGRTQDAVTSYRRALAINPERAETHNNLGLTLCRLGNVREGIAEYRKTLAINSEFFDAHVNLGVALCSIGKFDDAVTSYQKALAIQPDNFIAHMNLGDAWRGLGMLDEAIGTYQATIDLNPNDANAHNEMGNALRSLGRLEEAITSYRNALDVEPDFAKARRNEGHTLQEMGRLDEAIISLEKADTTLSHANLLECLYERMDKEKFYRELEKITSEDSVNVGVAAISAFASDQFECADPYPFCSNPLGFVSVKNLKSSTTNGDSLVDAVRKQIFELDLDSGHQSLLKSGFQSGPSLFVDPQGPIAELQAILQDEVASYLSSHSASDCLFIKEWPKSYSMTAWYVLMEQGGHLTMHNHPAGWLSGVFYLEMPISAGDEASIEFGLHGNNLPIVNDSYPKKTYQVTEGDLIMFPSSLFHRTVPFNSKQNRLCISFDINPN